METRKLMEAVVVGEAGQLEIQPVPLPQAKHDEAIVELHATSINRGEARRAKQVAKPGFRPGWDVAGVVRQAAENGCGPPVGARVVGLLTGGAWSEFTAIPVTALAELPPGISFAEASCLPVAGLTALYALHRGASLVGRRVLVTGATGGVGHLACQIGQASGATVIAAIRDPAHEPFVRRFGADAVALIGDEASAVSRYGPYDLIVESVGGAMLEACLPALSPHGLCVALGVSGGRRFSLDAEAFFRARASLTGMVLFHDLQTIESAATGLSRLLSLMARGKLRPHIGGRRPWLEIDSAADDLLKRAMPGKIVIERRRDEH
ncbi:zinc-binding dehydrogenase [Sphingosinicella ginsenosidimutans]